MGAFGGMLLTNKGRNLLAKAQTGVQLQYTRGAMGDGNLGGQSIPALTGLISQKKSLPIKKLKIQTAGRAVVGTVLSNQDVATGFYFREYGIFAQDPDEGEILYAYGNSGNNAEYIPPAGGADIIEKTMDVIMLVQNAANVTAIINSSLVYATQEDVAVALAVAMKYADELVEGLDIDIPIASLVQPGIVQLSNATNVTRENIAATEKSVKEVKDSIPSLNNTVTSTSTTQAATANAVRQVQENLDTHKADYMQHTRWGAL